MSEADDNGGNNEPEKEFRDNVSPKLQPKNTQSNNLAPPGFMGTSAPVVRQDSKLNSLPDRQHKTALTGPDLPDVLPELERDRQIAIRTRDQEVDAHTEKTHRLVDEEDLKQPRKEEKLDPTREKDHRIADRTDDHEVNAHYAKTHRLIDKEELRQLRKKAAMEQLKNNREHSPKRER